MLVLFCDGGIPVQADNQGAVRQNRAAHAVCGEYRERVCLCECLTGAAQVLRQLERKGCAVKILPARFPHWGQHNGMWRKL
jgi:hypothetical protein